jgi:hypothetical protein
VFDEKKKQNVRKPRVRLVAAMGISVALVYGAKASLYMLWCDVI